MADKQIHELTALPGTIATGNVFAVDTGENTYKIDYNALATAIISRLGGDPVTLAHGGTGATSAADARTNLGVMGEEIPIKDGAVVFRNSGIQYTDDSNKTFKNYKYVDLYFQIQGSECPAQRIYMGYVERTRKIGFIALNPDDGGVRQVACVFTTSGRYVTDCVVKFSNNNGSFSTIDTLLYLVRAVGYKW